MAIKKKNNEKRCIDLDGPEGNAYVLLGYAHEFSKQLGLDFNKISSEMKSGNYENLIKVFDSYFGEYIDLVRTEKEDEDED